MFRIYETKKITGFSLRNSNLLSEFNEKGRRYFDSIMSKFVGFFYFCKFENRAFPFVECLIYENGRCVGEKGVEKPAKCFHLIEKLCNRSQQKVVFNFSKHPITLVTVFSQLVAIIAVDSTRLLAVPSVGQCGSYVGSSTSE